MAYYGGPPQQSGYGYPAQGGPPGQQWGQQPQYGGQPPYGAPPAGAYGQHPPPPPQQGGYGAQPPPPPVHSAYPGNSGYGGGPPPGPPPSHGQPGAYGAPPATGHQIGYGQPLPPPQQPGYGGAAPGGPVGGYGAPPSHGPPGQGAYQQPYGAQGGYVSGAPPAPMGGPPIYLGAKLATDPFSQYATVPPSLPGYDPTMDVDALRKATKGFGTDEKAIDRILCLRSAEQMAVLVSAYKTRHGKDLTHVIKGETSGYYERTLTSLLAGPLEGDVELLHEACAGAGTKENLLTEIIIGRHPNELAMLRAAYQRKYHRSMDEVISGELSMKTRDAFNIALQGRWQDNGYVDHNMIQRDVHELGTGMRHGFTDELLVCSIIFCRSPAYLQALCGAFKQSHGRSLTKDIKMHFYGPFNHMRDALLYAVEGGKRDGTGVWRDAKMLEKAMAGAGTKDQQLIWRLVRYHWDRPRFEAIKQAYQTKYRKTLVSRVKGETSGHFEHALVTIIEGR